MPAYEDDVPKLAEIARTLSDFRSEFRDAVGKMVRADVYAAHMQTMELKLQTMQQEIGRLEKLRLDEQNDKRSMRNIAIGALFSAIVAFATALIK